MQLRPWVPTTTGIDIVLLNVGTNLPAEAPVINRGFDRRHGGLIRIIVTKSGHGFGARR